MTAGDRFVAAFGTSRVRADAPMAPLTTFKIGGPADWLVEIGDADELCRALAIARDAGMPVTLLGGGSNVLVSDAGIRGLVVRIRATAIEHAGEGRVRAGAGVTMNGLVRWLIARGLSGLEVWAGTPGTVGGAVYGNAHFRGRLIGDAIEAVGLVSRAGACAVVPHDAMEFAYDYSRLHRTAEIVMWAAFRVGPGEPAGLREEARASLKFRKGTQPLDLPSAGCLFQNPDPQRDHLPDGVPWSAGALIDRAGLKGSRVGGAAVSSAHANFIVNDGGATAADVRALIERCRGAVRERFGVTLRDEIVYLGDFETGS